MAGTPAAFRYDDLGRLVEMKDDDSNYAFEFTDDGMLKKVVDGIAGVPVSYEYDAAGRRTKMTAGDEEVRYTYNQNGRLSTIESAVGKVAFEYDQFGRRSAMLYPNGVKTTYTYDKLNRLTELRAVGAEGKDVAQYRYTYDILDNRTSMIEGEDHLIQYGYDRLSRLTQVTEGTNVTQYAYDAVGNRSSVTVKGVKEEYATGKDNHLLAAGKAAYQYDADGNMVSRTTADGKRYAYRYDAANRLAEAVGPEGTVSYGYAPNGDRVSRSKAGKKETRFLFDEEDIIAELTGNTQSATYLHGPGIDEPLALRRGDATVFYQADGLGSITGLTDAKGASAGRYTYDAFGQPRQDESTVANPYRYTGREWDETAGSYYYRARFYLPEVGRFASKDPLGYADGENRYIYVCDDPVNSVDPFGLFKWKTMGTAALHLSACSGYLAIAGLAASSAAFAYMSGNPVMFGSAWIASLDSINTMSKYNQGMWLNLIGAFTDQEPVYEFKGPGVLDSSIGEFLAPEALRNVNSVFRLFTGANELIGKTADAMKAISSVLPGATALLSNVTLSLAKLQLYKQLLFVLSLPSQVVRATDVLSGYRSNSPQSILPVAGDDADVVGSSTVSSCRDWEIQPVEDVSCVEIQPVPEITPVPYIPPVQW
jgi:RHS repeat-associated protein